MRKGVKRIWLAALAGTAFVPGLAHAQISDPKPGQGAPPSGPAPAPSATPTPTPDGTVVVAPVDESPIVPDAQFEAAMPKIEGDINAPLEALPSPTGGTPAPVPTTQGQATQQVQQQAEETFAAAPAEDAEFVKPLPPLSEFKVEPAVEDKTADKKSVTIRYSTHEEGLSALGLEDLFEDLSALENGGGRAANTAMVAARAREDEKLAVRLLNSRGYYDATAISTVEPDPARQGAVRATISVTPGPLYRLGDVKIDSDPTVPPGLLLRELNLNPGDPIEAERIQGAEANVALRLPQQGYPFFKVGQRDILLDGETQIGDYALPIELGPRAVFGDVRTEVGSTNMAGRGAGSSDPAASANTATVTTTDRRTRRQRRVREPAFGADHIRILRRYKPGELYDVRAVDDLRAAMIATSLFSTVSVEPVRTGEKGPDGTEVVDLLVRQNPGRPRTLAAEIGYSTGEGIRLTGSWTHRNFFPPEGALIVSGVLGTQEQGLTTTFRRSNWRQRDRTLQIALGAEHKDYDAYEAFTSTFSVRVSRDSTPLWQKRWTYFYGAELVGTNEDRWNYNSNSRDRGTWLIAAAPLFLGYDSSDNLLNPTRGFRIKANASPETSVRGAARPYARFMLEGTYYQPVSSSIVIAGRARVGSIVGIARDDLPPSRRYYAGGGGSVRGFGYQELGPRSPDDKPVGGRSLNEFGLEARYRFGNYGIVPFIDAGQVYEGIYPTGKNMRFGAGIGGRLYTNFGPIRVDVATPINRKPNESKIALYISIGQAF